jgi:predicted lysophospholipase L1 biosynthesis ABC-type transport system permease subunit
MATIVGVVQDNYERFPTGHPRRLCWLPWDVDGTRAGAAQAGGSGQGYVTLFIRSSRAGELAQPIRAVLRDLDPRLAPTEIGTLADLLPTHHRVLYGVSNSLAAASLMALGLAAVGLFGVIAYGAAQRTHEFGVRLAFGARPRDIARVLLRESVVVVVVGAIVGVVLASPAVWFLSQGLTTVRVADPLLVMGMFVILLGVSLAAAVRPMRYAVRVDPVTALRAE